MGILDFEVLSFGLNVLVVVVLNVCLWIGDKCCREVCLNCLFDFFGWKLCVCGENVFILFCVKFLFWVLLKCLRFLIGYKSIWLKFFFCIYIVGSLVGG